VRNNAAAELYGPEYYAEHLGLPYNRSEPHWLRFFGTIAENIIRELKPARVFDLGCAKGFLIEALREQGVEAWGSDISEYAIGEVRSDLRPFCWVASATEPIPGRYDLVTCIEVLEHLSEEDGKAAIRNMAAITDQVLFSSTPADFTEPTHINVRPVLYWLKLFRECSFAPVPAFDASFVSPQAFLLCRCERPVSDEELFNVALARHIAVENAPLKNELAQTQARLESEHQLRARSEQLLAAKDEELAAKEATLQAVFNSKGWRLLNKYRNLKIAARHNWLLNIAKRGVARKRRFLINPVDYQGWIRKHEQQVWNPALIAAELPRFSYTPTVSIVMPVFNTAKDHLEKAIESVRQQYYENWELCICDDASTAAHVRPLLEEWSCHDPRIKVVFNEHNGGISAASNQAIKLATGEFIGFLDHDDELSPAALYEVVKLLQDHPEADVIYSDEDKLEPNGRRCDPFFKPDWSPEYLYSLNYVCHFGVYRKQHVEAVGGLRTEFNGSQDYDLLLRTAEGTRNIFHIPEVLYHWRKSLGSTALAAQAKSYSTVAGQKAIAEHLQRLGVTAEVTDGDGPNRYRVRPTMKGEPLVSVIIPTRDGVEVLERCIRSIEKRTDYPNYEILVVDNGSSKPETMKFFAKLRHRVVRLDEPFNYSRLNNFGAQQARGDFLLLLNNDTEVISPGWMRAMLEICHLPGVAIAGAKLYYPDRTIQHAGVVLGIKGVAGHSHKHFPARNRGYFDSLTCIRNYSAVTAACMLVRREAFEAVGGFDEQLKVAFNDVDFCLRVREKGYRMAWTPYAELYHHESATRGFDLDPREVEFMRCRWKDTLLNDPYYNRNLTLEDENYALRM
jgi:GT2 family glycosyltransferase